jgi:hypothetical protein
MKFPENIEVGTQRLSEVLDCEVALHENISIKTFVE